MKQETGNKNQLLNLLSLQGLTFAIFVLVPAIIGKLIDFKYKNLETEEIVAVIVPFFWFFAVILILKNLNLFERKIIWIVFFSMFLIAIAQGMHLTANYFNDHLYKAFEITGEIKEAGNFYDELLSHQLWSFGYVVFILSMVILGLNIKKEDKQEYGALFYSGLVINSLAYAISTLESQTVFIVLPALSFIFVFLNSLAYRQNFKIDKKPVLHYFNLMIAITIVLFICWWVYYGGFPELTEVGLF